MSPLLPGWLGGKHPPRTTAPPCTRRPGLEHLEGRELLSGSPCAVPTYLFAGPSATGAPAIGYSPGQVRHAYGIDQVSFNGVAGDGRGQTIAIVDAYDDANIAYDLHQFDLASGLPDPPSFQKVSQYGTAAYPPPDAGWAWEISLDVEWAHAVAPAANILLVEAYSEAYPYLFAAVDYARRQPGVSVVSMSFGGGEFYGENAYDPVFTTPAGHAGVTFVAASGDWGAPSGYPAYSPNVVAVGGTSLYLNSASSATYAAEVAWSGSSGGLSLLEPAGVYQQGFTATRAAPDVAFDADPRTGVAVYNSFSTAGSSPWAKVGGTSLSAPCWAGLIAIANEGRASQGLGSLDGPSQTLPMLYQLPASDFHDVVAGGNGYSAGPGYDLVTGRGSPVANLVVKGLAPSAAEGSALNYLFAGYVNGYYDYFYGSHSAYAYYAYVYGTYAYYYAQKAATTHAAGDWYNAYAYAAAAEANAQYDAATTGSAYAQYAMTYDYYGYYYAYQAFAYSS
jgi:subtilase family serine protease